MGVQSAKELIVYQKAYKLAIHIFEVSKSFPNEERYALTSSAVFNWVNRFRCYRRPSEILPRRSLREFHKASKDFVQEAPVKWEEILRGKYLTRSSRPGLWDQQVIVFIEFNPLK